MVKPLQCNSDSSYPWAKCHRLRHSLPKNAFISFTSWKFGNSQGYPRFWSAVTNLGSSHDPFGFAYSLEQFTELRKAPNLEYSFITANKIEIRTSEETHQVRSGRWSFLSPWSQLPPSHRCVTVHSIPLTREAHLSFIVQSFYWSFVTQARLTESLAISLSSVSILPPLPKVVLISYGSQSQSSNHMIALSSMCLPHPESSY